MPQLFFLFTAVPLLELWLLFKLSGIFGFWSTVGLVLATGIAGAALARWQGWRVMQRLQNEMRQGVMPADAMGDGALILVAGVMLITPGVLTDALGLTLLVPPVRAIVKRGVRRWLAGRMRVESSGVWSGETGGQGMAGGGDASARGSRDEIIDVRVIDTHVVNEDT